MSEYLLIMHEVQRARLADQVQKVEIEPVERYGVIRRNEIVPEVKARFGLEARDEAGSKGATL
jgi:hypothetical protein